MELTALDSSAILEDRPFTHPARASADLAVLNRLLSQLRAALHAQLFRPRDGLLFQEWQDEANLGQRIIIRQGVELRSYLEIVVVGFFAERREAAPAGPISELDDELIRALVENDEVLCYFTSQLPGGQYGNLVLLASEEAKVRWNMHPHHIWAVRELAPDFYHNVRLHNGFLDGGILCCDGPVLTVTKYYDYDLGTQAGTPWRGVRRWTPPLRLHI